MFVDRPKCSDIFFFFFNVAATTAISTLSLHDALPISSRRRSCRRGRSSPRAGRPCPATRPARPSRSEEHTSELQSRRDLVCRLLLEKKKKHIHNLRTLTSMYLITGAANAVSHSLQLAE